jgi:hypothetical protein
MKLGAENREQVYLLLGLVLVAAYMVYIRLAPPAPGPTSMPSPTRPAHPRPTRGPVKGSNTPLLAWKGATR